MYYYLVVLLFLLYIASARYVLKRLQTRRARVIVWTIIFLIWGPTLIAVSIPQAFFQSEAVEVFVSKCMNLLIVTLLPLIPLTALGFGVARWATSPRSKNIVVGTTVFLGFFVLFADEIAGRVYLNYLCATEAGVKVYQTVELPAEYWDGEGRARFLKPKRGLDMALLGDRITQRVIMEPHLKIIGLDERRVQVVDVTKNEVVGEVISYVHWGGWILRNLSPAGPSGVDCDHLRGVTFWFDFYSSLFSRSISDNK